MISHFWKRRLGIAAFLVALVGATTEARAGETTTDAEDAGAEARRQFRAGVNLLDDPDGAKYEEAYSAFRKAYDLSQSPKVLGNVGFCAMHLERDGEAIDAYTAYLRDATDISERERAQIQRDLATLTSTVVRFRAVVKRPGAKLVLVDTRLQTKGNSVENAYPIENGQVIVGLRPGRHTLKVRADGDESVHLETILEPASRIAHEFTFAPKVAATRVVVEQKSPSVAGPVLLGVTGVLGAGAGVAMGFLASAKADEIANQCPNDLCPASYDLAGNRESAKTLGTIADVSMISGGALLGGALLWYALLPRSKSGATTGALQPARTAWSPGAMCTSNACAFQLQRGF